MLNGFRPEGRGWKLLPHHGRAAKQEDLSNANHASRGMVKRQRVVDDVAVRDGRHEEGGAHEELKAVRNGGDMTFKRV